MTDKTNQAVEAAIRETVAMYASTYSLNPGHGFQGSSVAQDMNVNIVNSLIDALRATLARPVAEVAAPVEMPGWSHWQARIEALMKDTAHPESLSVFGAMSRLCNEMAQAASRAPVAVGVDREQDSFHVVNAESGRVQGAGPVGFDPRALYLIGYNLNRYEWTDKDLDLMARKLMDMSGICTNCHGDGIDGEQDGDRTLSWACTDCNGSGSLIATPAPSVPAGGGEVCWLVEHFHATGNSTGEYHTGFTDLHGESRRTRDPQKARRYQTQSFAEGTAEKLGATMVGQWRAVEHCFHDTTPLQPQDAKDAAPAVTVQKQGEKS